MRIGPFDDLAIYLEHEPHDAMRRRMLRAEIHHIILDVWRALQLAHRCRTLLAHRASPSGVSLPVAFSSPGTILSIPSHGDRKSKLRNSCCNRTGSYTTAFCSSS